jgi:hypothetical protein
MVTKWILSVAAVLVMGGFAASAQAQGPWEYQFGYTQGYQNSFRNRLPAPPYFAIYPPVYYGQRYERPYGDSPYAAFPQLQSAPGYHPVPKETPLRTSTVLNPHAQHAVGSKSEPVAVVPPRVGRTVEIINPYAMDQEQIASRGR